MNWPRIFRFVALLFLVGAVSGFFGGTIDGIAAGWSSAAGTPPPTWPQWFTMILSTLAAAVVFTSLAKRQLERPWHHSTAVATISCLLSLVLEIFLLGQPTVQWLITILLTVVSMCAGVAIGVRTRIDSSPNNAFKADVAKATRP
jgi:hypothetical protein